MQQPECRPRTAADDDGGNGRERPSKGLATEVRILKGQVRIQSVLMHIYLARMGSDRAEQHRSSTCLTRLPARMFVDGAFGALSDEFSHQF